MSLRLLKFGAKNFFGYKEFELDLTKLGSLILVDGKNYDFAAASANGAGKSSLAETISYALFGKTIRALEAKHGKDAIVRNGSKGGAQVWLEAEVPPGLLRVERYRQHPTYQNKIRAWLNGQDVVRGRVAAETDERLEDLLGFNHDLFKRAVVIHSRLTESFQTLENRYIKQLTERLLGLRDFDELRRYVSGQVATCEARLAETGYGVVGLTEQVKANERELETLIEKQREHALQTKTQHAKLAAAIAQVNGELTQLGMELQLAKRDVTKTKVDVEKEQKTYNELKKERIKTEVAKTKIETSVTELSVQARAVLSQEKRYLNLEKSKQCPECEQPVSKAHIKTKLAGLAQETKRLRTKLKTVETELQQATDELEQLDAQINDADRAMRTASYTLNQTEQKLAVLTERQQAQAGELARLNEKKEELANPYEELIRDKRVAINQQEARLTELTAARLRETEHKRYLEFWAFAWGPSGMRSFMLDGATPLLNQLANFYLEQLTDHTMALNLHTVKANKDGTYRDFFDIDVTNEIGGSALGLCSDGELGCCDIALNLAISDMLDARVPGGLNLLFLDQVVDLVDPARAALAVRLLRQKTDQRWCTGGVRAKEHIFVITHRDEIRDQLGDRLLVEKRDGVCQVAA
jgi:DNA repair exonuclease SbcCD ATPase subunit